MCVGGIVFAGRDEAGGGLFGLVRTVAHRTNESWDLSAEPKRGRRNGNISPSRQKFNSEINQREQQKLHLLHSIHLIITIFYLYTTSHESSRSCCAPHTVLVLHAPLLLLLLYDMDGGEGFATFTHHTTRNIHPPPLSSSAPIRQDPELWPLEMKVDKEAQQAIRHECVCPYLFGGNQNRMK